MCLRQASVGAHCFECVKANAPSRREQRIVRTATGRPPALTVTAVIIAVNVAIFLVTRDLNRSGAGIRRTITAEWSLWGPGVDALGEWWRLVTGAFLHSNIAHVGMNMIMLFLLGRRLEQLVGVTRFGAIYAVSLLGGSAGALLHTPETPVVGASGAVYGVMGALYLAEKLSGGDPWNNGVGSLIVINVVISFLIPNISIGGHLGGLVAGVLAGIAVGDQRPQPDRAGVLRQALLLLVIGVVATFLALYGASTWGR